MKRLLLMTMCVLMVASLAGAKRTGTGTAPVRTSGWSDLLPPAAEDEPAALRVIPASAPVNTVVHASYMFNSGYNCTAQGWTTVDLTAQTGDYWHVDDFIMPPGTGLPSEGGLTFTPIQGAKSIWMGAAPPPASPVNTILCGYADLPGYGNGWNQSFCSKNCLAVSGGATPNLDIAFRMKFDSEPSYDATSLEYTTDCTGNAGWTVIEGGNPDWSGAADFTVTGPYNVGPGPVKVRVHFVSDEAWSNQDGLYRGFGVAVDSLSVETTAVEDFEGEAVGAHESEDWTSCNTPGYGNYLALFKKITGANYEDQCLDNISCYWAAIQGSTEFYTCGVPSQPSQRIVPHMNARGQYLANEIWSPVIVFGGSGSDFRLRYTVYRDLPLDNLVFHVWHVRTLGSNGCPGPWKDRGFHYYGDSKDWALVENAVGSMLDLNNGVSMQVAIGVVDMCRFWCGIVGTGACHSPAPYIDQVKVLRIDVVGPQWDVRDVDRFQDTFATDGTITGTARADAAIDIMPAYSPTITPGDSAVVFYLVDPEYVVGTGTNACGLLADPVVSTYPGRHKTKKQVYMYVAVWPQNQAAKTGSPLSEGPGGQANRYPFMGTTVIGGVTWSKIRMDYTYGSNGVSDTDPLVPARFNVDLNDNLFTPGDTVLYFFGATSAVGTNYFARPVGVTPDMNAAAANAMEFTILPAGGYNRGGDFLYVDGADDLNNQDYFYGAYMTFGFDDKIDRFDILSPSSTAGNRLAGRVTNVASQLSACYRQVHWDCGSYSVTLGDGTGAPEKSDDYALLNTFLANLTAPGGVYLSGDDVAEYLNGAAGSSAGAFRSTYMPFTLISGNHRTSPTLFGISPNVACWPGRAFSDNFFIFGGCPELNDFDVIGASGSSLVQMSYNTASSANGAVLSNINGNARVLLSGFSFAYIRDDELDGLGDRRVHLARVITFLGLPIVVGADGSPAISGLSQNYPNPFNPQTAIAFSLAERSRVTLRVYNVAGQLVKTLADEVRDSGSHTVAWDGRDDAGSPVASGVYFYRLVAPEFNQTRKMVLLK